MIIQSLRLINERRRKNVVILYKNERNKNICCVCRRLRFDDSFDLFAIIAWVNIGTTVRQYVRGEDRQTE